MRFLLTIVILPFLLVKGAHSEPENSVLVPPIYSKKLYNSDFKSLKRDLQWRILIHGIRNVALHPEVWGVRHKDRTINRALIPMRPFFLRDSEKNYFRLREIFIKLKFKKTSDYNARVAPERYTGLLDIGFNQEFNKGEPGNVPDRDEGYVFRVSASPALKPGFYYRVRQKYLKLSEKIGKGIFLTNKVFSIKLIVKKNEAKFYKNEKLLESITGTNLDKGLVSINTDWLPAYIEELKVKGYNVKNKKELEYSGAIYGIS